MQRRHPASRTGRPRSAAADTAILAATRQALVDLGWSKLTLSDVAVRAGVAKTTLYRRWAGKNELVVDAVAELFDELTLPDRGSLAADIEGVVLQFAAILARPEARSGLMAVVAEATRDEALRERIRASIVDRQKRLVIAGRARAQERGELPGGRRGPRGPRGGPDLRHGGGLGGAPDPGQQPAGRRGVGARPDPGAAVGAGGEHALVPGGGVTVGRYSSVTPGHPLR